MLGTFPEISQVLVCINLLLVAVIVKTHGSKSQVAWPSKIGHDYRELFT